VFDLLASIHEDGGEKVGGEGRVAVDRGRMKGLKSMSARLIHGTL